MGRSSRITWHEGEVGRDARWAALGTRGATVWFTGLSGSGKSTVAAALERRLIGLGLPAYVLDGDNLRHGLCSDLGFDRASRAENVRRAAEVACLLADAGVVALVPLISPYRADRELARQRHLEAGLDLLEVWVSTPLEECERRDAKGLYAAARAGELTGFTGIDDPYEPPEAADLEVAFTGTPAEMAADTVLAKLRELGLLAPTGRG